MGKRVKMAAGTLKKVARNLPVGRNNKSKTKTGSSTQKSRKSRLRRVFMKSKSASLRMNMPGDYHTLMIRNTFPNSFWIHIGKD
jgi:hypothetical protein